MSSPIKGSSSVINLLLQINITKKKIGGNENVACCASSFPCLDPAAQISPMLSAMTDRTRAFSQGRRCWKMRTQAALPALTLALPVKWPAGLKPAALHTVLLPRRNSPHLLLSLCPRSTSLPHPDAKLEVKAPQPLTRC